MTETFTPRPYQRIAVQHLLEHDRCALFAGMGMGKTVSTLNALDTLYATGIESAPTLILGPKRVVRDVWPDEIAKWSHLRGLELVPLLGSVEQRKRALKRDAPLYAINYENIQWLTHELKGRWPFRRVVADESTRLKSHRGRQGGIRAAALSQVAFKGVRGWWNLTGTPTPNGLLDLWGQTWFLDMGARLGLTFTAFKERWFTPNWNGFGVSPQPFAKEQIQEKLKDICLTIDAKDWFDLREPIVTRVEVHLPAKARVLYRKMEEELFFELENQEIEAFNAGSMTQKLIQLASGAVYVEPGKPEWLGVHDEKLDALDDVLEECGGSPVLVAYHFRSDLARLRARFPFGVELTHNATILREWNAGRIRLLFAHPGSAGHGLNLQQGGHHIVFFSHDWNLENYQQIIERIGPVRQLQAGFERPVFIYHIVAANTIDEDVIARRENKANLQEEILASMKRRLGL